MHFMTPNQATAEVDSESASVSVSVFVSVSVSGGGGGETCLPVALPKGILCGFGGHFLHDRFELKDFDELSI